MQNNQPVFILANPRSGSSLLRIICESHPQISIPPESGFLEWLFESHRNWALKDCEDVEKIAIFLDDLFAAKKFETWGLNRKSLGKFILKERPENYSELIALVYVAFALKHDKNIKIWGDKNNYYIHKTELLNELYPEAKYIHLIRDGRDVAASYKALKTMETTSKYAPKLSTDIEDIAVEWNDNNKRLMGFFKTLNRNQMIMVRYEDLVSNLEAECLRITEFLDIPFDKSMLDYFNLNRRQNLEPKETLDWKMKTLEKPDVNNIGKYKVELSTAEVAAFNASAHFCLAAFSYEL